MKRSDALSSLFAAAVVLVIGFIFLQGVQPKEVKAAEIEKTAQTETKVYDCGPSTSNHNLSYTLKDNGDLEDDGIGWDYCVLVNPKIVGEFVYIPESDLPESLKGKGGKHFFLRDSCCEIKQRVYTARKDTEMKYLKTYSCDKNGFDVKEDAEGISWDRQLFLIAPKIEGRRVYLDDQYFSRPEDGRRHFVMREDLVWINPPPDEKN